MAASMQAARIVSRKPVLACIGHAACLKLPHPGATRIKSGYPNTPGKSNYPGQNNACKKTPAY